MGELQCAVTALLKAFADGIAIIKKQRANRRIERVSINSTHKSAETRLSKSLKKSRTEVHDAYGKDLSRFGPGFAVGDAEAHSSLSAILFRLNAGFVSVIERFTRGHSTTTDYRALVNLSNASRVEAIQTFSQLSTRLSRSSLALVPSSVHKNEKHKRKRKPKSDSSIGSLKHARAKSAPQLETPLGLATPEGWVRPKTGRKLSAESRTSGSSCPKRRAVPKTPTTSSMQRLSLPAPPLPKQNIQSPPPIPRATHPHHLTPHSAQFQSSVPSQSLPENRKSIMSFASDSTKLGEIPERKWTRLEGANFPVTAYYPLEPYQEPEKPRSRFMRLFRKGSS